MAGQSSLPDDAVASVLGNAVWRQPPRVAWAEIHELAQACPTGPTKQRFLGQVGFGGMQVIDVLRDRHAFGVEPRIRNDSFACMNCTRVGDGSGLRPGIGAPSKATRIGSCPHNVLQ